MSRTLDKNISSTNLVCFNPTGTRFGLKPGEEHFGRFDERETERERQRERDRVGTFSKHDGKVNGDVLPNKNCSCTTKRMNNL